MNPALSRGEALVALRLAMQQARVDACLIPSADPHLSEYLPEYWQIRKWLTGFTGSVGTVVVTQDFAGIWVDSRYWVQAQAELANSGVTLMKIGVATDPAHAAWLGEHVPQGGVVAVDGTLPLLCHKLPLWDGRCDKGLSHHFTTKPKAYGSLSSTVI